MTIDSQPAPEGIDAETVMSAVFKLLGIYLLYSAVLQSGNLMSTLIMLAPALSGAGQVDIQQWGMLGTNLISVAMAAGLALLLIRHGGRAAHWLSIRADLQVPNMTPTRTWYRGVLVVIGVWVLAMQAIPAATTFVWVLVSMLNDSQNFVIQSPLVYAFISVFHTTTLLTIGLFLIFGAVRFGDWLYNICGAAEAEAVTSETQ